MAPTKLKCTIGDSCNYETQELEFAQSKELLESHLKYAHPVQVGSNNDRKPEKLPRTDLKLDSLLRTIGGSQFDETETQVVQLLIN